MKSTLTVSATAAAVWAFTLPVAAAELPTEKQESNPPRPPSMHLRGAGTERLGKVSKSSDVIGMGVKNLQDQKLGTVEELGVDLESGRIVQVIVSSGGVLGIGAKTLAVPPRSFSCDSAQEGLRLDMDQAALKAAPETDLSNWNVEPQSLAEVYRYYHQEPYFGGVPEGKASPPPARPLGPVERASQLIGMTVRNPQDETLGKVEDLMVDLSGGRVVAVVVSSGGILGVGEESSAVPPMAFHSDRSQKLLRLDLTKDALAKAPRFKNSDWPDLSNPEYMGQVYRAHHVEPYFGTGADPAARLVKDAENKTPLDQGASETDVDTTRRIRKEILGQQALSVNARNIKVITVNGRVTLRGPVNSLEEKRLLADIAGRIAAPGNVEDRMEVKREN